MPAQKYRPIRSEEDGEDGSPERDLSGKARNGSNIRHLLVNVIVFAGGLFLGLFVKKSNITGPNDELAQYSMVPCKFDILSR